jgi:cation/acetate symporter
VLDGIDNLSIVYSTFIIGGFYLMTPILGYGAVMFVGKEEIIKANPGGNLAAPLLGQHLGGDMFMAFVLAIAFVSILAVVAGLVISAASANLPVIILTIYWKKFNTAGAVSGMLGGLIITILLLLISPNIMEPENAIFPLKNSAILSVPLGFLCAYIGTKLSHKKERDNFDEIMVRINTGIHASNAQHH